MDDDHKALQVRITGLVQGVYYRAWMQSEAEKLGLDGWVRNEPDGSVSAVISGPDAAVATLAEQVWTGPPDASTPLPPRRD